LVGLLKPSQHQPHRNQLFPTQRMEDQFGSGTQPCSYPLPEGEPGAAHQGQTLL
jgi:hypothetical protein